VDREEGRGCCGGASGEWAIRSRLVHRRQAQAEAEAACPDAEAGSEVRKQSVRSQLQQVARVLLLLLLLLLVLLLPGARGRRQGHHRAHGAPFAASLSSNIVTCARCMICPRRRKSTSQPSTTTAHTHAAPLPLAPSA